MIKINDLDRKIGQLKLDLSTKEEEIIQLRHDFESFMKKVQDETTAKDHSHIKSSNRKDIYNSNSIDFSLTEVKARDIDWTCNTLSQDIYTDGSDGWKINIRHANLTFRATKPYYITGIRFPLFGYKTCNVERYKCQFFLRNELVYETALMILPKRGQNFVIPIASPVVSDKVQFICEGRTDTICLPKFTLDAASDEL